MTRLAAAFMGPAATDCSRDWSPISRLELDQHVLSKHVGVRGRTGWFSLLPISDTGSAVLLFIDRSNGRLGRPLRCFGCPRVCLYELHQLNTFTQGDLASRNGGN